MAAICGVELKNLKTWEGMESTGMQASVYIDGKRIGQVTDDAYGGDMRYDFDTTELEKRAEDYRVRIWNTKPENAKYVHLYERDGGRASFTDMLICDIWDLWDEEQVWKKAQKTRWKDIVCYKIAGNGAKRIMSCLATISDEELLTQISTIHKCSPDDVTIKNRYKVANDFVIA